MPSSFMFSSFALFVSLLSFHSLCTYFHCSFQWNVQRGIVLAALIWQWWDHILVKCNNFRFKIQTRKKKQVTTTTTSCTVWSNQYYKTWESTENTHTHTHKQSISNGGALWPRKCDLLIIIQSLPGWLFASVTPTWFTNCSYFKVRFVFFPLFSFLLMHGSSLHRFTYHSNSMQHLSLSAHFF